MHAFISILASCLLLAFAVPAQALTLIAEDSDVASIGSGDTFDNVVMFDTSNITMDGGAVTGHFLMIDAATATFTGGSVGKLDVFGDAQATVVIQAGTLDVDGLPEVTPFLADSSNCSTCTLSATLLNGDPVGPTPASALQGGQIHIVAEVVPEPSTAALFGFGLLGLALGSPRRRPAIA
jgi:hypothetical protein